LKTNNRFAYCHCLILMMTPLSKTIVYVCLLSIVSISLAKSGDATDPPFTNIAEDLNAAIAACPGDPYGESCGNKGIIWRTPDGIGSTKVVPSSLITNDLKAPTLNYPCGDPFCFNSFYNPVLGVVMKNNMDQLFADFDNFQNKDTYGSGVFYAHDSNSVDERCRNLESESRYDCPQGYSIDYSQDPYLVYADPGSQGAGNYDAGSPFAGGGGGGAGCHWDKGQSPDPYKNGINQFNAYGPDGNLVEDADCQCNYALQGNNKDWEPWVDQLINGDGENNFPSYQGYLAENGGAPGTPFVLDWAICWQNNPSDMVGLQNQLYNYADQLDSNLCPQVDWSQIIPDQLRVHWGWNEIPVESAVIDNPLNWDTLAISLPAGICWIDNGEGDGSYGQGDGLQCLDEDTSGYSLECQISDYYAKNWMVPGEDQQGNRPGSYVLLMKSEQVPNEPGRWEKVFFCQEGGWVSPNGYWQIVYVEPNAANNYDGECYIDWGPSNSNGDYDLCKYDLSSETWSTTTESGFSCSYGCDWVGTC